MIQPHILRRTASYGSTALGQRLAALRELSPEKVMTVKINKGTLTVSVSKGERMCFQLLSPFGAGLQSRLS